MSFSNSDNYLLSSGRDRQFSLFKRVEGQSNFTLVHKQPKAHDRIIWSCDWSMDDKYFITGSRDKTCKLWTIDENTDKASLYGKFSFGKVGVTAVAFAPHTIQANDKSFYLVAVGLENGLIQIWKFAEGESDFTCVLNFPEQ